MCQSLNHEAGLGPMPVFQMGFYCDEIFLHVPPDVGLHSRLLGHGLNQPTGA